MANLMAVPFLVCAIALAGGSAKASPVYWNLFNIEEEDELDAIYVTYGSLLDMLTDSNRTGSFTPDATGLSAANVVGSGSDGAVYWNLFNIEEEDELDAIYVTYGSLLDMLTDSNRTGSFTPDATGLSAANVVGSGAFVVASAPDESQAIPEPAALTLFAIGLAGLGIGLRRRG